MDADGAIARVTAVFDRWAAAGRAEGMERGHGPHARQAFEQLELESHVGPLRYLDVGCGNGYTVRWAAQEVLRRACGGRAVGLDGSGEMVARARAQSVGLPATFVHAPFPDHARSEELAAGSFHAVFSMEVFYYLPDLISGLAEVRRLLRPGGRFACVVDYYAENPASHGWPAELGVPMTLRSMDEWCQDFETAGLRVVRQTRLTVPAAPGVAPWKVTCGSLFTLGERPA